MSPEQARSVIAHELGHLSGKHSRFSGWIYRVRISWQRIMASMETQSNFGASLLRYFFNWYTPTFAAYSFALARANEYAADAIAAQLTSNSDVAHALVNSQVMNQLVAQYYWRPFIKQAEQFPEPQGPPYTQLSLFFQQHVFDRSAVEEQLQKALAVDTGHFDTHPALKDRLAAIQCSAMPPAPVALSAARHWFGSGLPNVIGYFDQHWLRHNSDNWRERYQHFVEGRKKLAELEKNPVSELSSEELWQLAALTEEIFPEQDCLKLFELYQSKYPEDGKADFVIGRLLLAKNDENGVGYMREAMSKQQGLKLNACEWLIHFYQGKNDRQSADYWLEQAESQITINNEAKKERESISIDDEFLIPEDVAIRTSLAEQIRPVKGIKQAWLAEKKMKYYPESKAYVLVFGKGWLKSEKKLVQLIVSKVQLDGVCIVLMKDGKFKRIANKAIRLGVKLF
jgi:hypothetical protein